MCTLTLPCTFCCPLINPFPNKAWFLCVHNRSLLKTQWDKEKLLVMSNFSFSGCVFYPFGELSAISIKFKIVVCQLFQFGRVKYLSFWKRLISASEALPVPHMPILGSPIQQQIKI